ncbi:hypothetical protein SAMN05216226_11292 [Halovenus aranensis]|uniref:Uncharacterized protein n=1 Tax=Halovenus aranensis TaxID=890420 RepID=A0A1G8XUZ7_9EURY|nr:hypothetical protein [Halovenus aranensis]SDJ94296.1 hypothetical protein SAMN05216226_11292 [Halovenus aranensis]
MSTDNSLGVLSSLSRADYILLSLPVLFFGIYGTIRAFVETGTHALAVAAVICCLIVADGLFVHPPAE